MENDSMPLQAIIKRLQDANRRYVEALEEENEILVNKIKFLTAENRMLKEAVDYLKAKRIKANS